MKTVKIRALEIGHGKPGIIVPIVGKTKADILSQASSALSSPADMVEWRADFYEDVFDLAQTLATAQALRDQLGALPILFTFRTKAEGGQKEIAAAQYTQLNTALAQSKLVDLVDVEIFSYAASACEIIQSIHLPGCFVMGSYHNFSETPAIEDLLYRMRHMQTLGVDIVKIAVMPCCIRDVLTLLDASNKMQESDTPCPVIAISMAAKGIASRLCGELFGSCMTFGTAGESSAPGQITAAELAAVLDIVHKNKEEQDLSFS